MNYSTPDESLKAKIKELSSPKWLHFYSAIFIETVFIFSIFVAANSTPLYLAPLFILLLGVAQHRLALLGHDACHIHFTSYNWLNSLTADLIGYPLFLDLSDSYRKYHFKHHANIGRESDPELSYRRGWGHTISRNKVILTFIGDLFCLGIRSQLQFLLDVMPSRIFTRLKILSFWLLVISVSFYFQIQYIPVLWIVSLATSFWAVFRLRAYLEHVGVPLDGKHTSYRFEAPTVFQIVFFPHNTWCHYEHHLFPYIPFHSLPKLRTLLLQPEYKEIQTLSSILPLSSTEMLTE